MHIWHTRIIWTETTEDCLAENLKEKLLLLHLQFIEKKISSENIRGTVKKESDALYSFVLKKKLKDIFPREKAEKAAVQILDKAEMTKDIAETVQKVIQWNYEVLKEENASLNTYLQKSDFFQAAKNSLGFKALRVRIVNFAVHSAAYSRMISSIIYGAIKDFMVNENPIAKGNAVASSIFKMGTDFLNNLPGMQGNFDAKITEFIRQNLSGRIQQSEKLIHSELESDKTDEIFQEVWDFLGSLKFSDAAELLPIKELEKYILTSPEFWNHIKSTKFPERMILANIREFYSRYENRTVEEVAEENGINREKISEFISEMTSDALDNEAFREFVLLRAKENLNEFYSSPEAVSLLG